MTADNTLNRHNTLNAPDMLNTPDAPDTSNPLISIIMPCHNAGNTVSLAINSVLGQRYDNWELIVIDDASADGSPEILTAYEAYDPRVTVLRNTQKRGAAYSRNRGIRQAVGEYIAFIDADDCWLEDKLAVQVRHMRERGMSISCTAYRFMNQQGYLTGGAVFPPESADFNTLLRGNTLACPTVMVRAEVMKKHLFIPDAFHEDYIAWLEIVKETGTAYGIPDVLALYRVGHVSKSSNKLRSAYKTFELYRRHFRLGLHKCVYYFFFYAANGLRKYIKRYTRPTYESVGQVSSANDLYATQPTNIKTNGLYTTQPTNVKANDLYGIATQPTNIKR